MFKDAKAFSGFSVNDLAEAKAFYGQTLGLDVEEKSPGLILKIAASNGIVIYPKATHSPATLHITMGAPHVFRLGVNSDRRR